MWVGLSCHPALERASRRMHADVEASLGYKARLSHKKQEWIGTSRSTVPVEDPI